MRARSPREQPTQVPPLELPKSPPPQLPPQYRGSSEQRDSKGEGAPPAAHTRRAESALSPSPSKQRLVHVSGG